MKRALLPITILAVAGVVFVMLVRNPERLEAVAPEQALTTVRVAPVEPRSVTMQVRSQGKVQASRRVSLSAAAAGPVSWISPNLVAGGYFTAGEAILRLDSSDFENALIRGQSAVSQAETDARHSSTELERYRELAARRLVSESQLQELQRQADNAAVRLRDARAALAQTELELKRSEVTAPFATIVESTSIELGQHVNRGSALATLLSADEVEVRLPLALTQLGYLDIPLGHRGELPEDAQAPVTLQGMFGGQLHTWTGRLVRTEAGIDASNNAVQAIVRVDNPQSVGAAEEDANAIPLPVGLYVEATIKGKSVDNIVDLPREVIRGGNQVLVVDTENRMHFREVEILRLESDRVLISGGLRAGELICMSPIQAVVDGMAVQVVQQ